MDENANEMPETYLVKRIRLDENIVERFDGDLFAALRTLLDRLHRLLQAGFAENVATDGRNEILRAAKERERRTINEKERIKRRVSGENE